MNYRENSSQQFRFLHRDMSNLRDLNLAGNQLSSISSSIFTDVITLESLDISSNQLEEFPSLGVMFGLHHINVSSNQITVIPEGAFLGKLLVIRY